MAKNGKYYWMRLKENFYDTEEMIAIESMPDGIIFSNILLKLYLHSLKYNGRLMLNNAIPMDLPTLASITRQSQSMIERALGEFQRRGLIEILHNGAIYMLDIQNYIGKSSDEADRIRAYQRGIKEEKLQISTESRNLVDFYEISTTEIRDIDIRDIDSSSNISIQGNLNSSIKDSSSTRNLPVVAKEIMKMYGLSEDEILEASLKAESNPKTAAAANLANRGKRILANFERALSAFNNKAIKSPKNYIYKCVENNWQLKN
ncbi:MAG: phage replisome organizer N-terminal domain-containing protein [Phascolarctobacterium sp.]|nr:phage replisome organizer N-terminal domain-containing protein [Phascolarctobacterium sp.]